MSISTQGWSAKLLKLPPESDRAKDRPDSNARASLKSSGCRAQVVQVKIKESKLAAVCLSNLSPGQYAALDIPWNRRDIAAKDDMPKAETRSLLGLDRLADEIEVMQPADFHSGIG